LVSVQEFDAHWGHALRRLRAAALSQAIAAGKRAIGF
jgi:hypothetical protein